MLSRDAVSLVVLVSTGRECDPIQEIDGHTAMLLFLLKISD